MRLKLLIYILILSLFSTATATATTMENYLEKMGNNLLYEYKDNPSIEDQRFYLSYDIKDVFQPYGDYPMIPIPILNAFNRTNSEILNEWRFIKKIRYQFNKYFSYKLDIEISNKEMTVYKGQSQAEPSYNTITSDNEKLRVNIGMKIVPEIKIYSDNTLLIQPYIRINLGKFKIETSYDLLKNEAKAIILSK